VVLSADVHRGLLPRIGFGSPKERGCLFEGFLRDGFGISGRGTFTNALASAWNLWNGVFSFWATLQLRLFLADSDRIGFPD
jgi:hypothetical protein